MFFMFSGALRAAGDAKTPMRLGIFMTALNIVLNVVLIRGLGPIPAFGTTGAAMGTAIASGITGILFMWLLFSNRLVIQFTRSMSFRPDMVIIRQLFKFGLPAGIQGIAMNLGGVLMLRYIGSLRYSAEAQAAYSVGYTELFSLITWTSVGLMGATAAVAGQNLGAGYPDRSAKSAQVASMIGFGVASVVGLAFYAIPGPLLAVFGMNDGVVLDLAVELLGYLAVSGVFVSVALVYTGGLQGTGDTRSPLYISIVSQVILPLGICAGIQATSGLESHNVWFAILIGHMSRCGLSVVRFRQGKWRDIAVDIGPARA
jgi:putative MATE family efflux protein